MLIFPSFSTYNQTQVVRKISSTTSNLSSPGAHCGTAEPGEFSPTPLGGEGAGGFLLHLNYAPFPSFAFPKAV